MEPHQPHPDVSQTAPWLTPQPTKQPRERRSWRWLALPVALAAGGILIGAAVGAGIMAGISDPTQSEEYAAQADDLERAEKQVDARDDVIADLNDDVATAEDDAREAAEVATQTIKDAEADLLAKATELDQREQAVAGREQAVTAVEDRIAATSIGTGIWTVGVDVEPGTYRVSEALTGYCYWSITRTGSNGDDIIENDGPTGGFPTVTLSAGQDFENSRCGTFVKQ